MNPSSKRQKLDDECNELGVQTSEAAKSESSSQSWFTCPVCHSWKTQDGEVELNRHVDECLNQQVLRREDGLQQHSTTASRPATGQTKIDRFIIRQSK